MKYTQRSFILVKGDVECERIVGDAQSFLLCNDEGYLLKEVIPSSTFLVCSDNALSAVKILMVATRVEKASLYAHISPSTSAHMVGYYAEDLKAQFRLGNKELENTVSRLFLIVSCGKVYRMEYRLLLNIAQYVRSVKLTKGDLTSELTIYNDIIQKWVVERISGSMQELCLFFLLSCWETRNFHDWHRNLEDALLEKVNTEEVRRIVEAADIMGEAKDAILESTKAPQ